MIEPKDLARLTAAMKQLGVCNFKIEGAEVNFWTAPVMATPRSLESIIDPGADPTKYAESDLFYDNEDPDNGLPR